MSLKAELRTLIAERGPLGVDTYMALCLHHPRWGYYATRPALGEAGDFITAPLVSQMFGELIGAWAVAVWRGLGSPERFLLAEIGPGDGTLMSDMLRVARLDPAYLAAAEVWLVDPSPPLREQQRLRLNGGPAIRWGAGLDELPTDAPTILVGNEVLDCLPAKQFQLTEHGWAERCVALDDRDDLRFELRPVQVADAPQAAVGDIVERSEQQAALARALAGRVVGQGGCALLIDYGRDAPGPGDTLQALRRHAKVDPLAAPGECDLTVWAEFDAVAGAAREAGAAVAGPVSQADFLGRLGIEARAAMLSRRRPDQAAVIHRQLHRLTAPDQMGALFKAIAIHRPGDYVPPGLKALA